MPFPKPLDMFYIVLVEDKVRGLYALGTDVANRCKKLEHARVVMLRPNEGCKEHCFVQCIAHSCRHATTLQDLPQIWILAVPTYAPDLIACTCVHLRGAG